MNAGRPPRGGGQLARLALVLILAIPGCKHADQSPPPVELSWTLSDTVVGPTTLTVSLRNAAGGPVNGAAVRVEGHMSHPGMAPVLAAATPLGNGVYEARFSFTMRGDWSLLVQVSLADGARLERRIDVPNIRPAA